MSAIPNLNRPPTPVTLGVAALGAEFLVRFWMWWLAVDWRAAPTYTSLVYIGPFSLFLIWAVYRGKNWGRWVLAVLYVPSLVSWTSAMVVRNYSVTDTMVMSSVLALKAAAIVLLFVGSSNAWFRAGGTSANPQGGANREQPLCSDSNPEPSAAAPRRSP